MWAACQAWIAQLRCVCWWGCGVMAAAHLQIRAVSRRALVLLLSHFSLQYFLHFVVTWAHRGGWEAAHPSLEHDCISATKSYGLRQDNSSASPPPQPFFLLLITLHFWQPPPSQCLILPIFKSRSLLPSINLDNSSMTPSATSGGLCHSRTACTGHCNACMHT